ncbi:formyl peptide receptor 2-like [Misgurnus anguillicaudatus]|uniref:formyl peptide receptor 2-like n=1 Tax=Misgurnus anguillicaudatus TaxID=75329 RepID=UPI003CCFA7F4
MSSNATVLHHFKVSTNHGKSTLDIVIYTIIVLLGTTGNSVVIWVASVRIKPNVTNIWLINLAVSDLIFCLSRIAQLIKYIFFDQWPFGVFLCKFNGFVKYTNMFCSVFLLAVISVDRVLCVWRPVLTRERRTLYAARVVSLGVWIMAMIFSSPFFVYREVNLDQNNLSDCSLKVKLKKEDGNAAKYAYYYIRFFSGFLFPFLVIFICYTLTAIRIRRTRLSGKSRPLRILALVVLAFFFCWAPYHILGLVKLMNKNHPAVKMGWHMASNLAYFNSCVNPMLYFCIGLNLRQRCNQNLLGVFHRALKEEAQTSSQNGTTCMEERSNCVFKAACTVHQTPV